MHCTFVGIASGEQHRQPELVRPKRTFPTQHWAPPSRGHAASTACAFVYSMPWRRVLDASSLLTTVILVQGAVSQGIKPRSPSMLSRATSSALGLM